MLELQYSHDAMIIEMGTRSPGHIRHLSRILQPTITYTTSISPSHMEGFGSIEGVLAAETEQYDIILDHGTHPTSILINLDDPMLKGALLKQRETLEQTGNIYTLSTRSRSADVYSESIRIQPQQNGTLQTSFIAHTPWGSRSFKIPLTGEHNVRNALAAIALAMSTGLTSLDAVASNLEQAQISDNRSSFFTSKDGLRIIDDSYNANPLSMLSAFEMISVLQHELPNIKHTVAVVNDMKELGDDAARYHTEAGAEARRLGINTLIVGGEFSSAWQKGFGGDNTLLYTSIDQIPTLLDSVVSNQIDQSMALFKASHSTGLHTIASQYATDENI